MKLYKFRPLGTCDDLLRLAEMLNTGKFWFSSLWDQNDSLEGVYRLNCPNDERIFSRKNKFKICSFSGEKALTEPLMWAHYANGFKGVAIEIKVDYGNMHPVKYDNTPTRIGTDGLMTSSLSDTIIEIVTHKTEMWEYECEYRCIQDIDEARGIKIGEITGIVFGHPYGSIDNKSDVYNSSDKLGLYKRMRELLQNTAVVKELNIREAFLTQTEVGPRVVINHIKPS